MFDLYPHITADFTRAETLQIHVASEQRRHAAEVQRGLMSTNIPFFSFFPSFFLDLQTAFVSEITKRII